MTPGRTLLVQQFARFGTVGVVGAVVDIATVYAAMATLGLYAAGLLAYFAAVTTTWALNRAWTFAGRGSGSLVRQWVLFLAAHGVGFGRNRGTVVLARLRAAPHRRHRRWRRRRDVRQL